MVVLDWKTCQCVCGLLTRHPLKYTSKSRLWGKWQFSEKMAIRFSNGLITTSIYMLPANFTPIGPRKNGISETFFPWKEVRFYLDHFGLLWPRAPRVSKEASHLSSQGGFRPGSYVLGVGVPFGDLLEKRCPGSKYPTFIRHNVYDKRTIRQVRLSCQFVCSSSAVWANVN